MMEYISATDGYEAGVCNIGTEERAMRRRAGLLGILGAIALGAILLFLDAPAVARLLVAFPLAAGFSGLIQAHLGFCANYGWRGMRNLGAMGEAERVTDARARASDRRRSVQIGIAAMTAGVAAAMVFAVLPF